MTKVIEELLRDTFWNINLRHAFGLLSSANPKNKVQSCSAPLAWLKTSFRDQTQPQDKLRTGT